MELPRRGRGDELIPPGELTQLLERLQRLAPRHDLVSVVVYAFDYRTRVLPFHNVAWNMAPAGPRAIGAALCAAGFPRTRVVLQQWNPRFVPSRARLDGRRPDLLLVSSLEIHGDRCRELLRDASCMNPDTRPLVIAGGPLFIYQPWEAFGGDPASPWGADVAVTGEEFVLLSLLEVVLSVRGRGEPLRAGFLRARDEGLLEEVPGLVYACTDGRGSSRELVDTGVPRLLANLDEQPHPVLGYEILEPPGRRPELAARPLARERVRRHTPIGSLVLTFGCKFNCSYCPIPAYNQRQHRLKSPDRIVDEMTTLYRRFGIGTYFGTDDNFFNDHTRTESILEALADAEIGGRPLHDAVRWGTEATVHDTLKLADALPLARAAGLRALWLGVEDLTATLVNKGQSVDKTARAFALLREAQILPMPMMMHHDAQPLWTAGQPYGLLNQVRLLRRFGATSLQVLMLVPAGGSRDYEENFRGGLVMKSVGGRRVESFMRDGNYVIASKSVHAWWKQLSILLAYLSFYNPLRLAAVLLGRRGPIRMRIADALYQLRDMRALVSTVLRTAPWALRLALGRIERCREVPASRLPMRSVGGGPADHDLRRALEVFEKMP